MPYFNKLCGLFKQFNMLDESDKEAKEFCEGVLAIPECNGSDCSARYEKMN